MRAACRRALLVAPLLLAVAFVAGCRPSYERLPWALVYQADDAGQRLPIILPGTEPVFPRPLQPHGVAPSPDGTHVLMATQEGELWSYSKLRRLPMWVLSGGRSVTPQFWTDVSPWSRDGRAFVYVQEGNLIYRRLVGQPRQLTTTGDVFTAAISPDGKQVAYGRRDAKQQDRGLWVVPVAGGEPKQLVPPTGDVFTACCPHWSPDGKWIAFLQAFEGGALGVVAADGSEVRQGIEAAWEPVRWLPDGKTVLFAQIVYGESADGVHSYNVETKQTGLIAEKGRHATYVLSPDGGRALVASWREGHEGKVAEGKLQIVDVVTLVAEGPALKLPGAVGRCQWAPDGRQMAVLVDNANGRAMLWYGRNGLTDIKPLAEASDAIGWARLWQRPWWRFWG